MSLKGLDAPKVEKKSKKMPIIAAVVVIAVLLIAGIIGVIGVYYVFFYKTEAQATATATIVASTSTTSIPTTISTTLSTSSIPTTIPTTSIATTTIETTCYDDIQNQGEEDVDCGGPCSACVKSSDQVALCLSGKGITIYLRDDIVCRQCRSIRSYFGASIGMFSVIDCDDKDYDDDCDDIQEDAEEQGKRQGYPMWNVRGELYPGASVLKIKAVTGC